MVMIVLKCGNCHKYFDGTKGYAFYKNKGLCLKCKKIINEVKNAEKENSKKEDTQKKKES